MGKLMKTYLSRPLTLLTALQAIWFVVGYAYPTDAQVIYQVQGIPQGVKTELEAIRVAAGLSSFTVTSYRRSVADEAGLIFDLLRCDGRTCSGVAAVKAQYCQLAKDAVDALMASTDWNDRPSGMRVLADNLKRNLVAAGSGRKCLMHVVGDGIDSPNDAIDVAPSSIPADKVSAFEAAVVANAQVVQDRFFKPGQAEKSYHMEFKH